MEFLAFCIGFFVGTFLGMLIVTIIAGAKISRGGEDE